jgi:flagellar biosynthetic protein FliQ
MDWMPQAIREGIFTIIFISGPLVVLAAVLGLAVGIVQAATQIQEQTLASAVKIIGLFLALIVFGFYMFQYLKQYTADNLQKAFRIVPSLGTYLKPRDNFLSHPVDEDGTSVKGVDIPDLNNIESPQTSASGLEGALNEPDRRNINVGKQADTLGLPKGQLKEKNNNVKKIDTSFKQVDTSSSRAPQPVKQNPRVLNEPVVRPQPVQRPIEPVVTPKPRPRKSLTGALDKIRSSLEEGTEVQGVE